MTGIDPGAPDSEAGEEERGARDAIADIQRSFLRLTALQTLLSLAGVFTGTVALYAALNESQAVRQQSAASVWPYVQFMIEDRSDADSAHFSLSFSNVGVGPARMRGMQLSYQGDAVGSWEAMTAALLGEPAELGGDYGKSSTSRRVLAPGESVTAFRTDRRDLALALQRAVFGGEVSLSYCYCSIFDQCWTVATPEPLTQAKEPKPGDCPEFGDYAFSD
ncbi:MAG: hypothetical protein AAF933_05535 [Pseudomonadota bacterium]